MELVLPSRVCSLFFLEDVYGCLAVEPVQWCCRRCDDLRICCFQEVWSWHKGPLMDYTARLDPSKVCFGHTRCTTLPWLITKGSPLGDTLSLSCKASVGCWDVLSIQTPPPTRSLDSSGPCGAQVVKTKLKQSSVQVNNTRQLEKNRHLWSGDNHTSYD